MKSITSDITNIGSGVKSGFLDIANAMNEMITVVERNQRVNQTSFESSTTSVEKYSDSVKEADRSTREFTTTTRRQTDSLTVLTNVTGKLVEKGLNAYSATLSSLKTKMGEFYDYNERMTKTFGTLAGKIGVFNKSLWKMQRQVRESYEGQLGKWGMSLEQVGEEWGSIVSAMEIADVQMNSNISQFIKLSKVTGLSGEEVGAAAKEFSLLGKNSKDVENAIFDVSKQTGGYTNDTAKLTKNVFVLGKNLIQLAGPKQMGAVQDGLVRMATKFGVTAKTVEAFADMTDSFDKTAESMAKLNTVFGTHINALELFAENDPTKQMEMVREQLINQGKNVDTLTRQEKKLLMQQLQFSSITELHSFLKGTTGGMEEQEKAAETLDQAFNKMKITMANMVQFFDKLTSRSTKLFQPLLKAIGLSGKVGDNVDSFGTVLDSVGDSLGKFIDQLTGNKEFQKAMSDFGTIIKNIIKELGDPTSDLSKNLTKMIVAFVSGAAELSKSIKKFIQSPAMDALIWTFSQVVKHVDTIVKGFTVLWTLSKVIKIKNMFAGVSSVTSGSGKPGKPGGTASGVMNAAMGNQCCCCSGMGGSGQAGYPGIQNTSMPDFDMSGRSPRSPRPTGPRRLAQAWKRGKGLSKVTNVARAGSRMFGSAITKNLGKGIAKRLPFVGAAAGLGFDLLTGESIGKSIAGAVGSLAGGLLGSLLGPIGTVAGGVGGQMLGEKVYEMFAGNDNKQATPAAGGDDNGPAPITAAYGGMLPARRQSLVGERGPELVTPVGMSKVTPNYMLGHGGGNQPITIQVVLDGEVIQNKLVQRMLRQQSA